MTQIVKECYQEMFPQLKTPCYKKVGGIPCVANGCLVKNRKKELERKKRVVDLNFISLLLHSACRLSALSPNNAEFLQREALIK